MTKTLSPPKKQRRVSVPVSEEVHQAFQTLARATGMSTGKAMGEWMQDMLDSVVWMAEKVTQARAAPRLVAQEIHAYALGLTDETKALLQKVRTQGVADRASGKSGALPGGDSDHRYPPSPMRSVNPPSCNTGGKVQTSSKKPKGGKTS